MMDMLVVLAATDSPFGIYFFLFKSGVVLGFDERYFVKIAELSEPLFTIEITFLPGCSEACTNLRFGRLEFFKFCA